MKKILLTAAAISAVAFAGAASAHDLWGGTISYNVGVTNDYVFRGVSQTDGKAALQGGIDYTNGMFYVGTWASNVDFAAHEIDVYGGVRPTAGKFSFDLGVITYQYADKALNTTELKAAVSHPLYKGTVGVAFYHNVDYRKTDYYELNGSYPLTDKLSLSGAVGEQSLGGAKYSTGNLGLTYAFTPVWSLDVRASDTNIPEWVKPAKPRLAAMIKATF